jgi:hypothetical protein
MILLASSAEDNTSVLVPGAAQEATNSMIGNIQTPNHLTDFFIALVTKHSD